MVHLTFKWMKILATQLEHVDTWCGGQENSEEREQAGALVAKYSRQMKIFSRQFV